MTSTCLNQIGLIFGLVGAVLLAFSGKIGVVGKDGAIIFTGLDPMNSSEQNAKTVISSHKRHRIFTPLGWAMIAGAFLLQFLATIFEAVFPV